MAYSNIFQKLDQDIAHKLQQLETQQKELLDKKKKLLATKQEIQNFLTSAQEIKNLVESEPELLKSLRQELGKIFSLQTPQLLMQKKESDHVIPNLEENVELTVIPSISLPESAVSESPIVEEEMIEDSIKNSTFVDAKGKNTSF
jgi:hypothetical protein